MSNGLLISGGSSPNLTSSLTSVARHRHRRRRCRILTGSLSLSMLIGLHFQYHLEIVVLERVVGQGFASVQVNGSWQLSHTASAEALMYMTKIFTSRLYLRKLWYPSSLSFMQSLCSGNDSSILAVTEGCQLSIWDLRMKENGGCVHRIYGSVGDIFYEVCSSSTSIAVGGADRTVTVYDPRKLVTMSGIISSINGHFCIPTKL
ncbi:hypothetical protein HYC85_016089 [Camellia sinensis]|uniref:Uncharacterized protein n=1 Tax=Camellia sinensis TaxID=4442 RepID=A0A7J7H0Q9_CAMSI|nr:hypothetical protein HYC85_016089 [Camellia sinensis]